MGCLWFLRPEEAVVPSRESEHAFGAASRTQEKVETDIDPRSSLPSRDGYASAIAFCSTNPAVREQHRDAVSPVVGLGILRQQCPDP